MLLGSAPETAYDLRFRLFDVPVRVHPLFWLIMILLSGNPENLVAVSVWVACALVSILVHEFGHGLVGRWMGYEPRGIVLYMMGGYCEFHSYHQVPWRRFLILAAGPGFGFILAALVFVFWSGMIFSVDTLSSSEVYGRAIWDLLVINIFYGVLNLFPIWPLDGGQMTAVVLGWFNPYNGARWTHVISLLVAGAIAIYLASHDFFMPAVWFGYFGFINYQMLQSYHDSYRSSYQ